MIFICRNRIESSIRLRNIWHVIGGSWGHVFILETRVLLDDRVKNDLMKTCFFVVFNHRAWCHRYRMNTSTTGRVKQNSKHECKWRYTLKNFKLLFPIDLTTASSYVDLNSAICYAKASLYSNVTFTDEKLTFKWHYIPFRVGLPPVDCWPPVIHSTRI